MPGMDRPPMPSPDVQSQMGVPQEAPPGQGLSQLQPVGQESPAPGAPNPHGFLMAQVEAVKKVLDQIAQAEPTFAPFAEKAVSIIDTGVSAVSTAPTGQPSPGPGPEASAAGGGTPPLG